MQPSPEFLTRAGMAQALRTLGVEVGDIVMTHGAMSRFGPMLNGPDAFIHALLDAVGATGTIMAYVDWDGAYHDLLDDRGRLPEGWKPHVPAFDPATSRAVQANGILAEFIRTTPGARRSSNPGASVAAVGARADWLTRDHPLDYGYGPDSPFAKLVEAGGKVLMAGAPLDTMTLLHHAEHLADLPGKRVLRQECPMLIDGVVTWRTIEEFDTSDPIVAGLDDDYFDEVVRDYLATGAGRTGQIGRADLVLVPAADVCRFGVRWLETRMGVSSAGF